MSTQRKHNETAGQGAGNDTVFELTVLTKSGGPLTKTIALGPDGKIISDGSACKMSIGNAQRAKLDNVEQLAALIDSIGSDQALALGTLRAELPDQVNIIVKDKLNGATPPGTIARIADNIKYRPGRPAIALIDSDSKGIPPDTAAKIAQHGGFWPTLLSLFPALDGVACVTRQSTSSGLSRSDTGESLKGSNGFHWFLSVQDGADVERFLKILHDRCWLAGFGWWFVGAGGQLLERSLIDRSVFGAERLVFEGPPILEPPLRQDRDSRRPLAINGNMLDSTLSFPPLTPAEEAKLKKLKAKAKKEIKPEAEKERAAFIDRETNVFIKQGMSQSNARRVASSQCDGELLSEVVLPFDDPAFAGCTVGDVLADPEKFEGATLADPLEGIPYGKGKAKILLNTEGKPWINSFAHGGKTYDLNYEAETEDDEVSDDDDTIRIRANRKAAWLNTVRAQKILIRHGVKIYQRGNLVRYIVDDADASDGRKTKIAKLVSVAENFLNQVAIALIQFERYDLKGNVPVAVEIGRQASIASGR